MNFIALVISLLLERLLGEHQRLRDTRWYGHYAGAMRGIFGASPVWSGPVGVLLVVGIPAALVGLVHALLGGGFFSVLALVFSILVLLFCLGPVELDGEVSEYLAAVEAGDEGRAAALAERISGSTKSAGSARNNAVAEGLALQFNERTFAVLFWFLVLGPLGAVLYRLAALARGEADSGFSNAAIRLKGILDWVPVRMIALGFALAGSFEDAITDWKNTHDDKGDAFWTHNDAVLVAVGRGALRMGDAEDADEGIANLRAALALVLRTLILWVVFAGLLTIAGVAT